MNWDQLKGRAQTQLSKLTADDIDVVAGERTELSGLLQARHGHAKDVAEKEIDAFTSALM